MNQNIEYIIVIVLVLYYPVRCFFTNLKLQAEFVDMLESRKPFPVEWLPARLYEVNKRIDENILVLTRVSDNDNASFGDRFKVVSPRSMFIRIAESPNPYFIEYDDFEKGISFTTQAGVIKVAGTELSLEEQIKAQKMRKALKGYF